MIYTNVDCLKERKKNIKCYFLKKNNNSIALLRTVSLVNINIAYSIT